MKGIILENNLILYYGNAAGYLTKDKAVMDTMFASEELKGFLHQHKTIREVIWQEGVFDRIQRGMMDIQNAERCVALKLCRIWQLRPETDVMKRFIALSEMREQFGAPNLADYKIVYDGEVTSNDLERIYEQFNVNHPSGYEGYSLSMSDVVELYDEGGSEFYYCDRIGFAEIEFTEEDRKQSIKMEGKAGGK